MRVDLDAKVVTRDGEKLGTVQRAVIDPQSNDVTEFVISTGTLFGHDVLLPRTEVDQATQDGDRLRLRLTKEEVERLPVYVPDNYIPPPSTWVAPEGLGFPYGGFLWPAAITPDLAFPAYGSFGGGALPGDAPGTAAATPTTAAGGTQQAPRPQGTGDYDGRPSLAKGDLVLNPEGDGVGVVDDVLLDERTGHLRGFVLRVGSAFRTLFGGGEKVEIPIDWVESIAEGAVHLRTDKLDRRARDRSKPASRETAETTPPLPAVRANELEETIDAISAEDGVVTPEYAPAIVRPPAVPMRVHIQPGMEVFGSDGVSVGLVKEVRGEDFLVDRTMRRDVYVPLEAVQGVATDVAPERVILGVSAEQVGEMGWAEPPLVGRAEE